MTPDLLVRPAAERLRAEVGAAHAKANEYDPGSPDFEYHRGRAHGLAAAAELVRVREQEAAARQKQLSELVRAADYQRRRALASEDERDEAVRVATELREVLRVISSWADGLIARAVLAGEAKPAAEETGS